MGDVNIRQKRDPKSKFSIKKYNYLLIKIDNNNDYLFLLYY